MGKEVLKPVLRYCPDCLFLLQSLKGCMICFRCLCLAGCNIEQKNGDGIKAEITALKHGYNDIGDLLNRLRNVCF
jgi:ankyrin repeat protein